MDAIVAVIPAAGLGTRFLPWTRAVSKELLPILNKPALHYIFEELVAAGITKAVMITREGKGDLRRYCEDRGDMEWCRLMGAMSVMWVNQSEPKGLGHAILSAEESVGGAWSLVALPDMIMDCPVSCSQQLVDACTAAGKPLIATHQEMHSPLSGYGVLDVDGTTGPCLTIKRIVEKPPAEEAPSRWIVSGRYLLPPTIYTIIRHISPGRLGEIQLTDALNVLVKEMEVEGLAFRGEVLDTGNVVGWLAANFHFARKDPAYAEPLASLGSEAIMGHGRSSPT